MTDLILTSIPSPVPPHALIIYGGGGHGKTLIELVRAQDKFALVGVVDDHLPPGSSLLGARVLGGADVLPQLAAHGVRLAVNAVGGIGNPAVRLAVFDRLAQANFTCPAVIHPSAWIEPSARISDGVQVLPLCYIGTDVRLGFGCLINSGAILSHDCVLEECVNISPGAILAGGVRIGAHSQVGMGVTINLGITIGADVRIGNSAVVKADVPDGTRIYAGTIYPPRKEETQNKG